MLTRLKPNNISTGFGNTNTDVPYYPSRLKHVEVSYIDTDTCNSFTSYNGRVEDNMLCAGEKSMQFLDKYFSLLFNVILNNIDLL